MIALLVILAATVCCFVTPTSGDTQVKHVHIVFMNHLDVGYDGLLPAEMGFINNILNKYFHEYFPRAATVAESLKYMGYYEKMIYTTHPWLVSLYMDCPANFVLAGIPLVCPSEKEKSQFVKAVKSGIITWHAGPMNMQMETLDPSLTLFGLHMSQDLDKMFNITRKHRTLSQRDVPALTQAVIPLLVKEGIEAISVGVNTVTSPPAVPPIFRWKFNNSSVIALWHPGGYPENPGRIPALPGGMSRKDCATFPGFEHALCFGFRSDNSGPPVDMKEVLRYYEIARSQFPEADVQASTFEDFISYLYPIREKLPEVDKEFGDTWIQGTGSDPRKVAEMRALMRARTDCLSNEKSCSLKDKRMYDSSRFLLKLGEHTWGLDSAFDRVHWSNKQFYPRLDNNTQNFENCVMSWQSQRNFSYIGIHALGSHSLANVMKEELSKIDAKDPDYSGFDELEDRTSVQRCANGFVLQFNEDGYITKLDQPGGNQVSGWASPQHPLGKFIYRTLNQSDFDFFNEHYPYGKKFDLGIGKFNMSKNVEASSQIWKTKLTALYKAKDKSCKFLLHVEFVDKTASEHYGAPSIMKIEYDAVVVKGRSDLNIELQWFKKPPTRLPEEYYFSFEPKPQPGCKWMLHKLGQLIDPLNVIQNGSQRLHIVDKGVKYTSDSVGMEVVSPDVGLVNVLTKKDYVSTIPLPLSPISDITGMAFNLYNNIWDVNFIFWYPYEQRDVDQKFRFYVHFL